MNKQEAIKIIEQSKIKASMVVERKGGEDSFLEKLEIIDHVPLEIVVNTIDKIGLKRVVVQKFVAEWYEKNKDDLNTAIYKAITEIYRKINSDNDDWLDTFEGWLAYEDNSISILVQMQLFGYEIEQEKLYTVEIPNPNATHDDVYILGRNLSGSVSIWRGIGDIRDYDSNFKLTEAEIKEDFEWAWQWAKPVEV